MEKFADKYFTQTTLISSLVFTLIYLVALVLSGQTALNMLFEKIITGLFSAYSAFTCIFGLIIMMFINDRWLGNLKGFRFHISVGFVAGAIASIYKLAIDISEIWPVVRKLVGL